MIHVLQIILFIKSNDEFQMKLIYIKISHICIHYREHFFVYRSYRMRNIKTIIIVLIIIIILYLFIKKRKSESHTESGFSYKSMCDVVYNEALDSVRQDEIRIYDTNVKKYGKSRSDKARKAVMTRLVHNHMFKRLGPFIGFECGTYLHKKKKEYW